MEIINLTKKNNYDAMLNMNRGKLSITTEGFLQLKAKLEIVRLDIAAVGNSIANGFSMNDAIAPLLTRNEELYNERSNVGIDFYSFSRAILNSDASIMNWYLQNVSHKDINKMAIEDIKLHKDICAPGTISTESLEKYSSLANENDTGFRTFNTDSRLPKIMIYNGVTGSFVDAISRGGKTDLPSIISYFKKDLIDLKAFLHLVYSDNPTTQVYVCGLPNILGIGIIELVNTHIKKICAESINATYVNSASRNVLYEHLGTTKFETHYLQPEYLELYDNVLNKIIASYSANSFILDLNTQLMNLNEMIDVTCRDAKNNKALFASVVKDTYDKHGSQIQTTESLEQAVTKFERIYEKGYLDSFFFTPKEEVKKQLLAIKK